MFDQKPASLKKLILQLLQDGDYESLEMKTIIDSYNLLTKNKPKNFNDCIAFARKKFEKMFSLNIKALLKVHPIDKKNQDGSLFWSPPKKPPQTYKFDP